VPARPGRPSEVGLVVGRLQAGPAEQAVSSAAASVTPPAAEAPVLTWRDDYGTRHRGERP
jgi:hypothetical protein